MRKRIIAGNWKMNKTVPESVELVKEILKLSKDAEAEVVVCPNYVCLVPVSEVIKGSNIELGAQDVHWEEKGAFTGKISCDMLLSAGVKYVIIGHSEQRTYFHETNETVNMKIKAALLKGLNPIICIGETLEQRESGKTEDVIKDHVFGAYKDITKEDALKTVIAYEPVWAIGTGKVATPEQAQQVHAYIRSLLEQIYDSDTAESVRIQYGGSMKPANAKELLSLKDVDGGLIGGAALKAEDFNGIINA